MTDEHLVKKPNGRLLRTNILKDIKIAALLNCEMSTIDFYKNEDTSILPAESAYAIQFKATTVH